MTAAVDVTVAPIYADISYAGAGTPTLVNSTSTGPFTVDYPTAGEALLAQVAQGPYAGIQPPSGWAELASVSDGSNLLGGLYVAAPLTADNGWAFTSPGAEGLIVVTAYLGVDPADPVDDVQVAYETGTTAAHVTPEVAAETPGAWLVVGASERRGFSGTITWSGADAERVDVTTTAPGAVSLGVYDSAGPVEPGSYQRTLTASASGAAAIMWGMALRPRRLLQATNVQDALAELARGLGVT